MSSMTQDSPHKRVGELLIEWEERRERGEEVAPAVLCEDCPELIEELENQIRELKAWDPLLPHMVGGRNEDSSCEEPVGDDVRASAEFLARLSDLTFHAKGGLGIVYKAWHDELQRIVAVKFLQRHHAANPFVRSRFLREAEITAKLEHPGIVPIYGIGRDSTGAPCYVMRFIEGPTLEESIKCFHATVWASPGGRNKAFRDLMGHYLAASAAVAYAHGKGVLHRDIKPSNMVLGPLGQVVVLDWGLGKSPSTCEEKTRRAEAANGSNSPPWGSATLGRMGTLGYMSREQQDGDWRRVNARSDVFSLGVTLYFLLTGKLPFPGGSAAEVLNKVENGKFQPPRHRAGDPSSPRSHLSQGDERSSRGPLSDGVGARWRT